MWSDQQLLIIDNSKKTISTYNSKKTIIQRIINKLIKTKRDKEKSSGAKKFESAKKSNFFPLNFLSSHRISYDRPLNLKLISNDNKWMTPID